LTIGKRPKFISLSVKRGAGGVVRQDQHVGAVGAEGQFSQRAGEAGAFFDQREQAARGHIQAGQRAAQQADGFAHQPVVLVGQQHGVGGQHGGGIAAGLEQPGADFQLVGAHVQDGVVEFARHLQRPPGGTGGLDAGDVGGLGTRGGLHREGGRAPGPVDLDRDVLVGHAVGVQRARQWGQRNAFAVGRAVALRRELLGALAHHLLELLRLGNGIDQAPVHGTLAAHAFGRGAEDVGQVMAHMALVGDAGQAAGARQHAQQRHLGQADGGGAVVDQHDLVAGQGQFVAAAGAGAVDRGEELQAAVAAGVLDAVAGFVGELAEVDLPGVAGQAQHEDVGARAEGAVRALVTTTVRTSGCSKRMRFRASYSSMSTPRSYELSLSL
jgi:hypothetical protein